MKERSLEILDNNGDVIVLLDKTGIQLFTPDQPGYSRGVLSINGVAAINMGGVANQALLNTANVFTANQSISNTAPSLALTDTTASAKSLTIAVDANRTQIRESAGAAGSLIALDLANNRMGIATGALTLNSSLVVGGIGGIDAGFEINISSVATLQCYNRNSSVYANINIDALGIFIRPSGTTKIQANSTGVGFFTATPVAQQVSAANLTNSVTAGGTDDTITNYTDLTSYATDAAAIRNAIYQLAKKLKQVNDSLRLYGLLT